MRSFINHFTQVDSFILMNFPFRLQTSLCRYLLQFYLNFQQRPPNCFLIHFAPHLLKTFELFNYAFNVFVSIVSGKHGRHELFTMLFCRMKPTQTIRFNVPSKANASSTPNSTLTTKTHCQNKLNTKSSQTNTQVNIPLLPISNNHTDTNHYHYQ